MTCLNRIILKALALRETEGAKFIKQNISKGSYGDILQPGRTHWVELACSAGESPRRAPASFACTPANPGWGRRAHLEIAIAARKGAPFCL